MPIPILHVGDPCECDGSGHCQCQHSTLALSSEGTSVEPLALSSNETPLQQLAGDELVAFSQNPPIMFSTEDRASWRRTLMHLSLASNEDINRFRDKLASKGKTEIWNQIITDLTAKHGVNGDKTINIYKETQ